MATYPQRAVLLYDSNGNAMAVQDGVAIPAGTSALLGAGSDYATTPAARLRKTDSLGNQHIAIAGVSTGITPPSTTQVPFTSVSTPSNRLGVSPEPTEVFEERFDGAVIDTINRWSIASSGAGSATVGGGNLALSVGTNPGDFISLTSMPLFTWRATVHVAYTAGFFFEAAPLQAHTHRFIGMGTPGNNTTANPLTDAVGFEVDTAGNINACVYKSGVKVFSYLITTFGSTAPNLCRLLWNSAIAAFTITGLAAIVRALFSPAQQSLPFHIHMINDGVGPAAPPSFTVSEVAVADVGRNTVRVADGTNSWRTQSVDGLGSAQVAVADFSGNKSRINSNAELTVTERTILAGAAFDQSSGGFDARWTTTVANGATATQGGGVVDVATGVTANASYKARTAFRCRYLSGTVNIFQATLRTGDTGVANNVRRWGVFDDNDGYFFELNGTVLYAVTRKATVDTKVASTAWNQSGVPGTIPFTVDTNAHKWEILYGDGMVSFIVDNLVRQTLTPNYPGPGARVTTNSLPLGLDNINSGGSTTNAELFVTNISAARYGADFSIPRYTNVNVNSTYTIKTGPGTLHRIVVNSSVNGAQLVVYDNTAGSGATIATIKLNAGSTEGAVEFGIDFSTGLTAVLTGGGDWTVVYD